MKKRKILILILLFTSSFITISLSKTKNQSSQILVKTIAKHQPTIKNNETIQSLQKKYNNNDIKGTISLENESSFHYPVAQARDNSYYLTHDYYKNNDKYGVIFADYRINLDSSYKVLLFGHNSSRKQTPFGALEEYYNYSYYQNHKYLFLKTATNNYKYEIFSVYIEYEDFTYMNLNFSNSQEWYNHLLKLQQKSFYKTKTKLQNNDKIIILQTCSNHPDYQKYEKKYLLVIAKKIENT